MLTRHARHHRTLNAIDRYSLFLKFFARYRLRTYKTSTRKIPFTMYATIHVKAQNVLRKVISAIFVCPKGQRYEYLKVCKNVVSNFSRKTVNQSKKRHKKISFLLRS